jgi:hypothetical protein
VPLADLLIRNHIRDHHVPWNQITDADVTDTLRVHTANQRLRFPGVQLVMRDMRKQRGNSRKLGADAGLPLATASGNSIWQESRADN